MYRAPSAEFEMAFGCDNQKKRRQLHFKEASFDLVYLGRNVYIYFLSSYHKLLTIIASQIPRSSSSHDHQIFDGSQDGLQPLLCQSQTRTNIPRIPPS